MVGGAVGDAGLKKSVKIRTQNAFFVDKFVKTLYNIVKTGVMEVENEKEFVGVRDLPKYGISHATFYNQIKKRPELLVNTNFLLRNGYLVREVSGFLKFYMGVIRNAGHSEGR